MTIPKEVQLFRKKMANDLNVLYELLLSSGLEITGSFQKVINELKSSRAKVHPVKEIETLNTYWGYDLDNFRITFNSQPRGMKPSKLQSLSLIFEVGIVGDFKNYNLIKDPFEHLTFNIIVEGSSDGVTYLNAWHLDRHLGGKTDEAHPIYHMHYGGDKLDKANNDYGQSLLMGAPRLMHPPMDLILGIDFIVSNFFPVSWEKLQGEGTYTTMMKTYQDLIYKPYSYGIASHWNSTFDKDVEWMPQDIFPTLVD